MIKVSPQWNLKVLGYSYQFPSCEILLSPSGHYSILSGSLQFIPQVLGSKFAFSFLLQSLGSSFEQNPDNTVYFSP